MAGTATVLMPSATRCDGDSLPIQAVGGCREAEGTWASANSLQIRARNASMAYSSCRRISQSDLSYVCDTCYHNLVPPESRLYY